ncbi:fibroblast growth factor receptor 3-like [Patiria miniata]|uniref:Receptor protein-tyrosine kinase n=1 Tax=Patiria miniata TaxID=46514 RepID=A0A914AFL6_PATMI|nr:fibroblast growth factor receptor 3-like [Patiria miniata]
MASLNFMTIVLWLALYVRANPSFNCTFEDGMCGWTQSTDDDSYWRLDSGGTASSNTGPLIDKTKGNSTGNYCYYEASGGDENDTALLVSPVVHTTGLHFCFNFWYNMYGDTMGTLNVFRIPSHGSINEGDIILTRTGQQTNGSTWLSEEICLPNIISSFHIAFQAVRGSEFRSDIAIDDLSATVFTAQPLLLWDSAGTFPTAGGTTNTVDGADHSFHCVTRDVKHETVFSWKVNYQETAPDSSSTQEEQGVITSTSVLSLPGTSIKHGDLVQCWAFTEYHFARSISVTIHVKVPPKESSLSLYDSGGNVTSRRASVMEGARHSLLCTVRQTRPAATIKWFLNDALQRTVDPPSGESEGLVDTTSSWTVVPSRANHGQRVKCVARTAESQRPLPFAIVTLDVRGPPDTPAVTGNSTMTANETVQLTCRASHGYPADWQLVWTNGGLPLAGTHTTAVSTLGNRYRFSSTLNFTPTREDNRKMITCSARRGSWTQDMTGSLGPIDVQYWPEFSEPSVTPSNHVEEGDDIILSCSADANPKPADFITWEKVESPGSLPSVYSNGTSTLLLSKINREQAGTYRCRGDNGVPPVVYSSPIVVIVRSPVTPSVVDILTSWPFLTVVSVLGILLLISITIQAVGCFYRKRKRPSQKKEYQPPSCFLACSGARTGGPVRVIADTECYENMGIPMQTIRAVESDPVESTYADIPDCRAAISRDQLTFLQELTQGTFGKVLLARAVGIEQRGLVTHVVVKTVKDGSDPKEKENLIRELNSMKPLSGHANIVKLLGYCINEDPIYVIVEHVANGNLKEILTDSRSERVYDNLRGAVCASLSPRTLLSLARGVAEGMAYLASQGCLHQDLAARNVLVGEDMVSKISNFGFASDVAEMRTYKRKSTGFSPLRWMALESVLDDVYTIESDVWSFGVLLWEIVTLGGHPYPTLSAKKVVSKVKTGYRMPRPDHCRLQLYQVMRACWTKNPAARPTFATITEKLGGLLGKANECILLESCQESIYKMSVTGGSDFEKI